VFDSQRNRDVHFLARCSYLHLGVVVGVDDDLVVRPDELEGGVDRTDGLGPREGRQREQQEEGGVLHQASLGLVRAPGAGWNPAARGQLGPAASERWDAKKRYKTNQTSA